MLSQTIVKYIQRLAFKKFRDEEGVFIAEGPKIVREFLLSGKMKCKSIYATSEWLDGSTDLIPYISPQIFSGVEFDLERISQLQTPNKVLAVFYKKEETIPDLKNTISIMLDEIQDPGNLGTIIRTADWFGIKNIICSKGCADCYNPKVVQATMGSLARVNVMYTNLEEFINET